MNDRTFALLSDIAKLLRQYGVEEFERLATVLESRELADTLAKVLRGTSVKVPDGESASSKRLPPTLEAMLEREPVKRELLLRIHERLLYRKAFPKLRDVVEAIESTGISVSKLGITRREQAVRVFLEQLTSKSNDEIAAVAEKVEATVSGGSGLGEWSTIILGRDKKKEP